MKYYKKFYEIGNNRYSTIEVDGDVFIASESFIKLKKKFLRKQEELTQGLKLLKFTPEIAMLFTAIANTKEKRHKKDIPEEFIQYTKINNKKLKKDIVKQYNSVYNEEYARLDIYRDNLEKNIANIPGDEFKARMEELDKYRTKLDSLPRIPEHISFDERYLYDILNVEHLYNEKITSLADNEFYYTFDEFGKVTIYRVFSVDGVIQNIDTFIYDRKLVIEFLKTMYKEGR